MPACPKCGEENPERFRLCGFCGTPLDQAAVPAQEERKVVSVLFVDLVGFTARSEQADPEDVRAMLRPYHALLKQEIERYNGRLEKFVGDAAMGVFGAPTTHEDDAERAVRAALRILESIAELNDANPGLDLSVRAAVNTGEAVVSLGARPELGESVVAGDVVNTASRLQGVAPVGSVVVGEITQRATKDFIDYRPLEPVALKGKAEPVPIWEATTAKSRFGVDVSPGVPTPFIGRDDELELLKRTYARCAREPSIQLVTVTGEPGVGKTRLLSELFGFIDSLPDLVWWRQGRCLPYGEGITFWALGEVVKGQAGILESDGPEEAEVKLAAAVEAVVEAPADREWIRSRLASLVGLTADAGETVERGESFAAWQRFLEALASRNPLVMVFEDLHWADASMLEFVEHLVDYSTGVPMLVVCTARPELYEKNRGWGGGKRNSTTLALSPLTELETRELLSALLSDALLPDAIQSVLLERAGGNPLYAEEFVRMLSDRGILERSDGDVRIAAGVEIPVPDTVQALIAARLDTVPPDRKSLLHDASVMGKVFWAGAVSAMGGLDEALVRDGLHELTRKELVRPARSSSVKDQAEYAFWHLLVRDVAYSQIPRAARAAKHRAAAEWMERLAGERVSDHAELLAHHYERALELARATGAPGDIEALEDSTIRALLMAGDRAVNLDLPKAETHYRRALELLEPGHPDRGRLLAAMASAASDLGRLDEAQRLFEEAIEETRDRGELLRAGEAMAGLARVLWRRGDTARAGATMGEATQLIRDEPPGPEHLEVYNQAATLAMLAGLPHECLPWAGKAIELADGLGLRAKVVRALETRGVALTELGDSEGLEELREALRMGQELGLGYETSAAYNNLADTATWEEGPKAALAIAREGIDFAERRGLAHMAVWSRTTLVAQLFQLGEWDELLQEAEGMVRWDQGRGGSQITPAALTEMARVLVLRGHTDEAAQLQKRFLGPSRQIGDPQALIPALATAALVEQARGDTSAAAALALELADATADKRSWRLRELPEAVRILVRAERIEAAEDLLHGLEPNTAFERQSLPTARAILAEARGTLPEALDLYGAVAKGWAEYGHVLERGRARLAEGRCLVGMSRLEEAAASLREAREVFSGLGARPFLEEADGWMARPTSTPPHE